MFFQRLFQWPSGPSRVASLHILAASAEVNAAVVSGDEGFELVVDENLENSKF